MSDQIIIIAEKTCTKCEQVKSIENFHRNKRSPDGFRGICKTCRIEADKNYYLKTRKEIKRERYIKNRPTYKQRPIRNSPRIGVSKKVSAKEYYINNKAKIAEDRKLYYQKNKEKISKRQREYYKTIDKEHKKTIETKWRRNNPEAIKSRSHNRRSRKLKAGGIHTKEDIKNLLKKQNCRCVICKKSVKKNYELDHIQPISKGGTNDIKNLQILCRTCNRRKSAKDPITFMQENGFLL